MHKKGPPRLNYSELHLHTVIGKLSLDQSFYFKKSPSFQGIQSLIALNMWVTAHSLVTSVVVERKYISMLRGWLLNELTNLHILEALVKALRGL